MQNNLIASMERLSFNNLTEYRLQLINNDTLAKELFENMLDIYTNESINKTKRIQLLGVHNI